MCVCVCALCHVFVCVNLCVHHLHLCIDMLSDQYLQFDACIYHVICT